MRKGYKVFGLLDFFSGRLFWHGHTGRFTAESYCAFLAMVLAATDRPLVLIQDGARYHTATRTREFIAAHADRLTIYQLPSYSPDYNPIEHLWRTLKRRNTHNRYFPTFADLTTAVETALAHFRAHPSEVKQLMGSYLDRMAALAAIDEPSGEVAQAALDSGAKPHREARPAWCAHSWWGTAGRDQVRARRGPVSGRSRGR